MLDTLSPKNADTNILTKILANEMQLASVLDQFPWIDLSRNIHVKSFLGSALRNTFKKVRGRD